MIAKYDKLKLGERKQKGRFDRLALNWPFKTVIAREENRGIGRVHFYPFSDRDQKKTLAESEITKTPLHIEFIRFKKRTFHLLLLDVLFFIPKFILY